MTCSTRRQPTWIDRPTSSGDDMTAATASAQHTTAVPTNFNGWVETPRMAELVRADEVRAGDILLLDTCVSRVHGIRTVVLAGHGPAVKIDGQYNTVRFPWEYVRVIRADESETS